CLISDGSTSFAYVYPRDPQFHGFDWPLLQPIRRIPSGPTGVFIRIPLATPALMAGAIALLTFVARRPQEIKGHCPCGSNLTGTTSGIFPEGGRNLANGLPVRSAR